jgi:hypothetical protein
MAAIFQTPTILESEDDKVVLIYGNFIIGNITKENAELSIERINKEVFNPSEFELIINANEVFEYEFEPGVDTHIMFGVKKNDSITYENIDFKDSETTKNAEKTFKNEFKQLGFKRVEQQISALRAAVVPGSALGFVAVMGTIFTWYAYDLQTRVITRTRIVKWHVFLFEKIAGFVGYYPFLIITIALAVFCLIWMMRRMSNPPLQIKAVK